MKTSPSLVKDKLAVLQARFQLELPDKIADIEQVWGRLRQEGGADDDMDVLYRLAHSLAGSGGVFGAKTISKVARELCEDLKPLDQGQRILEEPKHGQIRVHIDRLKELTALWEPSMIPYTHTLPSHRESIQSNRLIFLVDDDVLLVQELTIRLEKADFQVRCFTCLQEFAHACEDDRQTPAVIIMDMVFAEGDTAGAEAIQAFKSRLNLPLPVIFISIRNDIEARLAAAKAGAVRYFNKPLDTGKLIQTLESIIYQERANPYRILLVDDDQTMLEFYATVLSDAGMEVKTLTNPLHTLEALQGFMPDLVLTDVYMPECSGLELAQVIRQDDDFALMPIVFLSAEQDFDRQLAALGLGGDDFLMKSLQAHHLVAAVKARAKRSRWVSLTNQALHKSIREGEYMRVAMDQHAIVSIADVAGRITHANDKFCEISGYAREELINQNHRILKSGVHEEAFYQQLWETITHGKVWMGNVCNRRKNGTLYWLAATIVPFLDEDGLPYKYVSVRTDITDIVEMGESLKTFRHAMDSAVDGMAISDSAGEYVYVNEALATIYGYASADEMTGRPWRSFFTDEVLTVFDQDITPVLNATGKWAGEITVQRKNGASVPIWISLSRLPDGCIIRVVRDISEEKAAQALLQQSEARYSRSQDYANIGTWDWDIQTGELFWSDRIGPLFGYGDAVPETTYENFLAAIHPDDRDMVIKAVNACVENNADYNIEHRVVWRDGTVRWLLERGDVNRGEDGTPLHMLGVVQDITERRQLQESLAQQKMLLDLLRNSMDGYVSTHNRYETVSNLLQGLLQLTDSTFGIMGEVVNDADGRPRFTPYVTGNLRLKQAERLVDVSNAQDVPGLSRLSSLIAAVITRGEAVIANDFVVPEGMPGDTDELADIENFLGVPVFYGEEVVGFYGIGNRPEGYDRNLITFLRPADTTFGVLVESIRSELREQEAQQALLAAKEEAEHANRAKSQFLSSMSHELRTPMNAIIGFGQLLEMEDDPPLEDSQQENVGEILKAGKHLLELINEVLDLARIEAGRIDFSIEPVYLRDVLPECLSLISSMVDEHNIEITISRDGRTLPLDNLAGLEVIVQADQVRLKQVLLNLLSNAVKYNRQQGSIRLMSDRQADDLERISIQDTGAGLNSEQQAELFQAFHRMGAENSEIEGTGIGLVITKKLIEQMGGNIGVESEPGKGSTFWIELPAGVGGQKARHANQRQTGIRVMPVGEKMKTVLYVEDNPANLRLVQQVLGRRKDIKLWSAHEPGLGLELAIRHKPDLVMLDINLPGMDGYGVLAQLRQQAATREVPVIAISANAMPKDIEKGREAGFAHYLTKPINIVELIETVNLLLDENELKV